MIFRLPLLMLSSVLLLAVGTPTADERKQGHGAGGVRADHASEQGLEKGDAWAGSKEKRKKGKEGEER